MNPTDHVVNSSITLATFDRLADAELLEAALKEHGFEPQIEDERRLQRLWFRTSDKAGIHVQVPEDSVVKAKEFVASQPEVMQSAIRCPSCRSSRVQYPAMTRKNVLPTLVAQLLVLVHLMDHEYYCEDCHFTWVKITKKIVPKTT